MDWALANAPQKAFQVCWLVESHRVFWRLIPSDLEIIVEKITSPFYGDGIKLLWT